MFILIKTEDYGPIEVSLVGTYNSFDEAHDDMEEEFWDEVSTGEFPEGYRDLSDFDASCWTEMDGGTYWHIFNSETD